MLELYNKGFSLEKIFNQNATGIKTERDVLTIQFDIDKIKKIIQDLRDKNSVEVRAIYSLDKDGRDWQLLFAQKDIINNKPTIIPILYRPFDYRYTAYTGITKGFMAYPREKIMRHLFKDNYALISTRLNRGLSSGYNFITNNILDLHLLDTAGDSLQVFPLYLYPENNAQQTIDQNNSRQPNLNADIVTAIASKIGLAFVADHAQIPDAFQVFVPAKDVDEPFVRPLDWGYKGCFTPLDLLDYIYAVLHSPTYRDKYKEFLKIDFPRVPYPKDADTFWQLVNLGGQLRELHLLESPVVNKRITQYPIGGDNKVGKIHFENNNVYINYDKTSPLGIEGLQHFANVPEVAWNFYIGGYQPAQKWLKDRKDRTLSFEDIIHYQKIIAALSETDRLMKEIDAIEIE